MSIFSDIWPILLAIGGGLAALWGYGRRERKKGRDDSLRQFKESDRALAKTIRDRAANADADSVSDAGWRD